MSIHPKVSSAVLVRLARIVRAYSLLVITCLGMGLVAVVTWSFLWDQALDASAHELDLAMGTVTHDLTLRIEDDAKLGHWLARQDGFAAALKARSSARLVQFLTPLQEIRSFQSAILADRKGNVLAHVGDSGQKAQAEANILNLDGVEQALDGKESVAAQEQANATLFVYSALPVYDSDSKQVNGVLLVGFNLDDGSISAISQQTSKQVALAYDGQITNSTMMDDSGHLWTNKPIPNILIDTGPEEESNLQIIGAQDKKYLFKFARLPVTLVSRRVLYGLGVPLDQVQAVRWGSFKTLGLDLLPGALVILALGLIMTRAPGRLWHRNADSRLASTLALRAATNQPHYDELEAGQRTVDPTRPNRDHFLLDVMHELRAPLSALRSSIELLLEDYGRMNKRETWAMLQALDKSSLKFQLLVENLADVETIKAGRFLVRPTAILLDEVLDDTISQIAPLLRARGQTLELKQAGTVSLFVMADPRRILQVLVNLLANASKYGPEGEPIILSVCKDDDLAYIGVTDHGPGIPAEEQQGIFQRFYRARQHAQQGNGIGLGLGIVREIVAAHGGAIYLSSSTDGTTFWFSLPMVNYDSQLYPEIVVENAGRMT